MSTIADILKIGRQNIGLNMSEVGRRLKINHSLLSRYESGDRLPTENHVNILSEFYKIDRNKLYIELISEKILKEVAKTSNPVATLMIVTDKMKRRGL